MDPWIQRPVSAGFCRSRNEGARGKVEEEGRRSKGRIVVTFLCPWISAMRCPSRGLLEFALAR